MSFLFIHLSHSLIIVRESSSCRDELAPSRTVCKKENKEDVEVFCCWRRASHAGATTTTMPGKKKQKQSKTSLSLLSFSFDSVHSKAIFDADDSPAPRAATASGGAAERAVRSPVSSPETAFVFIVDVGRSLRRSPSLLLCAGAAEAATATRAREGAEAPLQTAGAAPRRDERTDERIMLFKGKGRRRKKRKRQRGRKKESENHLLDLLLPSEQVRPPTRFLSLLSFASLSCPSPFSPSLF